MPGPPMRTSSPAPPMRVSLPSPPMRMSSSVAAVERQLDRAGGHPGGLDDVVAVEHVDGEPVVGRFRAGDVHLRGQSEHGHAGRVAGDDGHVVAVRAR